MSSENKSNSIFKINAEKAWSPFSAPLLIFGKTKQVHFQYSSIYTISKHDHLPNKISLPKPICRPISKNYKKDNSRLSQKKLFRTCQPSSTRACSFCKSNGEPQCIYSSHSLRNADNSISCPVLKVYQCELCGANGAHTIKYCPIYLRRSKSKFFKHLDTKKM